MSIRSATAATLFGLVAASPAAHALLIDDLSVNQSISAAGAGGTATHTENSLGASSSFSSRTLSLSVISATPATNGANMSASGGVLSANKDSSTRAKLDVAWSSGTALDFTAGGHDSIEFLVVQNNVQVGLVFDVLFDNGGGTQAGYYQFGTLAGLLSNSLQSFAWDAATWTANMDGTGGAVSVDWTKVLGFSFHVDSSGHTFGTDTQISFFQTSDNIPPPSSVPAPGVVLLMATGLIGLGLEKRRRRG